MINWVVKRFWKLFNQDYRILEKTSFSRSKISTYEGKLLALDLDTSPVIEAMGVDPSFKMATARDTEYRDRAGGRERERETK